MGAFYGMEHTFGAQEVSQAAIPAEKNVGRVFAHREVMV